MTLYTAVLFVHAIAVLALTAGLTVEAWMLLQLRRAVSAADARSWMTPIPRLAVGGICALAMVFLTGIYLTEKMSAWTLAWPRFAVLEVVLFAVFGALTGRRLRAIRRLSNGTGGNSSELSSRMRSSFLKLSLHVRVWIVFGAILLMAAMPGFIESLCIVTASVLFGSVSSMVIANSR